MQAKLLFKKMSYTRKKNFLNKLAEEAEEHFCCIIKSIFVLYRPTSFTISNDIF